MNNPSIETGSVEAMKYISELTERGMEPKVIFQDGIAYLVLPNGNLTPILPLEPSCPDTIKIFSLNGFVDFILDNREGFPAENLIVKVADPTHVYLLSTLARRVNVRDVLASCEAITPRVPFDRYLPSEDYMIELMTKFEDDENRKTVLAVLGRIKEEQSDEVADDGFSQRVTVRSGVSRSDEVTITNPVYLRPRRTFHEVAQPASPFTLRFKEGPQAALFESDGGQWQNEAVANVAAWLKDKLDGSGVLILA